MITAFTICANNYLAHAKTLAVSFKKHHPKVHFVIAIVDRPNSSLNYATFGADEVIWVHKLIPEILDQLNDMYSIAELCTVIKPELCLHFFKTGTSALLYIDPDIKVYSPFIEVFEAFKKSSIILTPHICSPTGETGHPLDKDLMRTGIYNLGFLAVKNNIEIVEFIKWWNKRVKAFGYHDLQKGFFYDQIWLGYAQAFLENVYVLRHLGYNVANWNLHERKVIKTKRGYRINNESCHLKFFHFSHFKKNNLPVLASYNQNYTLNNRPDVVPIFKEYQSDLERNGYEQLNTINYAYGKRFYFKQSNPVILKQKSRFAKFWISFKKSINTLLKVNKKK